MVLIAWTLCLVLIANVTSPSAARIGVLLVWFEIHYELIIFNVVLYCVNIYICCELISILPSGIDLHPNNRR